MSLAPTSCLIAKQFKFQDGEAAFSVINEELNGGIELIVGSMLLDSRKVDFVFVTTPNEITAQIIQYKRVWDDKMEKVSEDKIREHDRILARKTGDQWLLIHPTKTKDKETTNSISYARSIFKTLIDKNLIKITKNPK